MVKTINPPATLTQTQLFHSEVPFPLESGETLKELTIAYVTYGQLSKKKDNVIWICHALTGDANANDWWADLVGKGKLFNPEEHFIICANILGSCYGTTGPNSLHPDRDTPYGLDFPLITIKDIVKAHELLRTHLGIERISLAIGGSVGGQQVLEWSVQQPAIFDKLCVMATNAKHSPWGIAFNESQRMALQADNTFGTNTPNAGQKGLEAARAMAILSYRHYERYEQSQKEENTDKITNFKAQSYQRYQGYKLWKRFTPTSYWTLSRAMDSHNVGRNRGGIAAALATIQAPTLVLGIDSDILFPLVEQQQIAKHIPHTEYHEITSTYGHDGFLIEFEQITAILKKFINQ